MAQVKLVVVDDERGEDGAPTVAELRRALARHPVYDWATEPGDRVVVMVHQAFCRWGTAQLAWSLGIPGPGHHFEEAREALRRRRASHSLDAFVAGVGRGIEPGDAMVRSGSPSAARPLVDAVWAVAAGGSEAAMLGALVRGLPCCILHAVPASDRLDRLSLADPVARTDAELAARALLAAQAQLLDGALAVIRRRHMALHPSAWRR